MIKEVVYIANDGTRFYNEINCMRYEEYQKTHLKEEGILFLDKEGKPLSSNYQTALEHAHYIYINDTGSFIKLIELNNEYNFEIPQAEGFWYKNDKGQYVDVSARKAEIKLELEKLTKEKENISNAYQAIARVFL